MTTPSEPPAEALPIGVLTVDASLTVRTWSEWIESATGIPAAAACGRALADVVPDAGARGVLDRFTRVLESGQAQVLAPAFHHYLIPCAPRTPSPNFERMQQLVTLGALREGDRVVGVMATIEDVTPRLDAERALAADLQSEDPGTRGRAAERLQAVDALHAPQAFTGALRHDSWQVRRAAVQGLSRHASRDLLASLIAALRDEHHDFNVLSSALQLLSMTDVDVTVPLAELLRDPDPGLRIQAALALGEQRHPAASAALIEALEDPDANVRFHAIEALGLLQSPDAVDPLSRIAESRDFFLAFPAIDALARIDDPRVAPRLVPLLDDDVLAVPVVEALGRLGGGDVVRPLVALLDRPRAPVGSIAAAVARLHAGFEAKYAGGAYIVSEFQAALTPTGARQILDTVGSAHKDELRALVLLLGWVQGPAVERALTRLLGDADLRADVLEALVRRGAAVVGILIEQLQSEDQDVTRAAVTALGRLGDPRATEALTRMLDGDRSIVSAAAGALARIGDARAFEPLLALLGHPDATVRQAAIGALNSLGHPDMADRVAALLKDADPHTRESAVRIAGYFGYAACADAVFALYADEDEAVRRAALEHLPFIDEARAFPVLQRAVKEDTPRARASAATALARVDGPGARALLLEALEDADAWVRYFAARALAHHGHEEALDTLASLASGDPAPHVRIAALESIGAIGGPRAAAMLQPYAGAAERDIAVAALGALGRLAGQDVAPPLQQALRSDDPARRLAAIQAFSRRGGADSISVLHWTAGGDASAEVANAALDGLVTLAAQPAGSWAEAIDAVVELSADSKHRDAAVAALARMPGARSERVARGLTHASPEVRRATVEALTRMKHPDASLRVRAALDAPDPTVREAAVTALERVGTSGLTRKLAAMAAGDADQAVRRAAEAALARQPYKEGDGGARA